MQQAAGPGPAATAGLSQVEAVTPCCFWTDFGADCSMTWAQQPWCRGGHEVGLPRTPGPPPQGGLLGDRGLRDVPRCGSQREGAVDSPQRVKDRHKRRCLGGRKGCRRVFDQGSCQNQRLSRGLLLRGHKAPGALVAPGTSAAGRRGWMQPGAGQRPAAAGGSAGRKHCLYLFIFNSFVFGSSPFHDVWQQSRPLLFCD